MEPRIEIANLSKTFGNGRRALDNVSLSIAPGEMVALIGPSGSGKSTLLRHIAGLSIGDCDDGNCIMVGGKCVQRNGRLARDVRRHRAKIGFIFQQFNLVDRLPVETNVLAGGLGRIPAWRSMLRYFTRAERAAAHQALARVGIAECCHQRASTLSGGQQQRAAIARTLVQNAKVILADEPVSSLDPNSSRRVMEILTRINREDGIAVVVTLHQVELALKYCPRVVALRDGAIAYDGPNTNLDMSVLNHIYGAGAFLEEQDLDFGARGAIAAGRSASPAAEPEPGFERVVAEATA
jgi:phosphonate transport system ATP-binding protein